MTTVRCQKSGPQLPSWTWSFPAKKQKQIKEMIHGIKAGFDIVVSYPCADTQRSMLSFKIDS